MLPHNVDAEASILGGVLLRNEVLLQLENLELDDFYDHRHKVVFEAIRNLEAVAKPIDVVTLENEIEKGGKLDAIGGIAFLGELALRVPTADNVVTYSEIVRDHSQARKLILASTEITEKGREVPSFFLPFQPQPEVAAKSTQDVELRFWLSSELPLEDGLEKLRYLLRLVLPKGV